MKINDILSLNSKNNYDGQCINKKVVDAHILSFSEHLSSNEVKDYEEHLFNMFQNIKQQGEKLSGNVNIKEFNKYKKMISDYLKDAVHYSLKYEKNSTFTQNGKSKIYATVKKINKKIDSLTEEILSDEKNHIDILKKIDEIKGLLLDLTI